MAKTETAVRTDTGEAVRREIHDRDVEGWNKLAQLAHEIAVKQAEHNVKVQPREEGASAFDVFGGKPE